MKYRQPSPTSETLFIPTPLSGYEADKMEDILVGSFSKKAEVVANVAVILVALLLSVVLIKQYLLSKDRLPNEQPSNSTSSEQIRPGTKLSFPGVDWTRSNRTLLMVLLTGCHFCTESAAFYQKLAQEKAEHPDLRLVVALQDVERSRSHLKELGVSVDEVIQVAAGGSGIKGTPTLILINNGGEVENIWTGKLSSEKEAEVLSRLDYAKEK